MNSMMKLRKFIIPKLKNLKHLKMKRNKKKMNKLMNLR